MAVTRMVGAMADCKPSVSDLTGKEWHFAKEVAGGFDLAGDGEQPCGVITEGKAIGLHSSVATGNQLKVLASEVFAVGNKVASGADATAIVADAADYVFGRAKSAAGIGELVEIEVTNEGVLAA